MSLGGPYVVVVNSASNPVPISGSISVGTVTVSNITLDGSGNLLIAGSVTANAGTNLNTSALALETGGNLAAMAGKMDVNLSTRLKPADTLAGVTTVSTVTSITNPVAVTGTFFQTTQPVSAASLPLPSNAAQESGGNLDFNAGLNRQKFSLSVKQFLFQMQATPTPGFYPMEISSIGV